MTLLSTTTRTLGEIIATNVRNTESLAFNFLQRGEAAEEAGDTTQANAWYAESDRLFAEVEALKASL